MNYLHYMRTAYREEQTTVHADNAGISNEGKAGPLTEASMALMIPCWWRKSVPADATPFFASTNAGARTALRASAAVRLSFVAFVLAISIASCAYVHGAAAAEAGVGSVGDRARVR